MEQRGGTRFSRADSNAPQLAWQCAVGNGPLRSFRSGAPVLQPFAIPLRSASIRMTSKPVAQCRQKDSSMEDSDARKFAKLILHIATGLAALHHAKCCNNRFSFNPIESLVAATLPLAVRTGCEADRPLTANPAGDIVGVFKDGVGKQHGILFSGGNSPRLMFLRGCHER